MSPGSAPRIAVVGAGLCGVVLAHHLARAGLAVTLVERNGRFGPGLAYRTEDPRHLLNTPAGRMSALADDPDHFTRWARARDPAVRGGSFLPRGLYGVYLRELLAAAGAEEAASTCPREHAHSNISYASITCISGHVASVMPPTAGPAALVLADGRRVSAARVVLASGNLPPALPAGLPPAIGADPRYCHDPWSGPCRPIDRDGTVLVLGTGLSALDLALGLGGAGHRGAIHLLSRHGLVPHAHRSPGRAPDPQPPPIETWPCTARGSLRALRAAVRAEEAGGGDWRDVIADLRPVTPALWRRLPPVERDRFVRHLRVYWEVHRHRAAPETAAGIAAMRASGQLKIHAGRIEYLSLETSSIAVTIRPRGARDRVHLAADALVNATGPASDPRASGDPLLADLAARGLLVPDPLGAAIDDDGAVLDRDGRPSTWLFAVGALRRPQLWETTAALELAAQCEALARLLIDDLSQGT